MTTKYTQRSKQDRRNSTNTPTTTNSNELILEKLTALENELFKIRVDITNILNHPIWNGGEK